MMYVLHAIFAPGLWDTPAVRSAFLMGTIVAVLSGVLGVFVVIRGQSFVGHALTDIGAVGASGAILAGVNLWYGFVGMGLLAAGGIDLLGERTRGRDVETGLVLSFAMGLGALLLYFDTRYTSNANVTMQVLFGSIFVVSPAISDILMASGLSSLLLLIALYRPLLLSTVNPDLAQTAGVPVRLVSLLFLLAMGVAVENAALVVGALLSTALLIGPAATAIQWVSRPIAAMALAAGIGVVATCGGILLAYDSYDWVPLGRGWPVSFFIPILIMAFYLLARLTGSRSQHARVLRVGEGKS